MNAAKRQLDEINRLKKAISKSKSQYLINDYSKQIKELYKELREYCMYREYNFAEVVFNYEREIKTLDRTS